MVGQAWKGARAIAPFCMLPCMHHLVHPAHMAQFAPAPGLQAFPSSLLQ